MSNVAKNPGTVVPVTSSGAVVLARFEGRSFCAVDNRGAVPVAMVFGAVADGSFAAGRLIPPGASWESPAGWAYRGPISCFTESGSGSVVVSEV